MNRCPYRYFYIILYLNTKKNYRIVKCTLNTCKIYQQNSKKTYLSSEIYFTTKKLTFINKIGLLVLKHK